MNCELPDVQGGFREGRGTRDQIANICSTIEKAREFQKNIYFCFITMLKPLIVWITANCGKFLKKWEYQTTLKAFWETCMQVKKQQLEPDMEQQTGSKLRKGVHQGCILLPCLFNLYTEYISERLHFHFSLSQSTLCEMQGWMKHKLESRLLAEIAITSDMT